MLICALDYSLPEEGKVASIVYIPEGSHTITPSVNGKPKNVEIKMEAYYGEEVAATFQRDLEQRLAANVRRCLILITTTKAQPLRYQNASITFKVRV